MACSVLEYMVILLLPTPENLNCRCEPLGLAPLDPQQNAESVLRPGPECNDIPSVVNLGTLVAQSEQ